MRSVPHSLVLASCFCLGCGGTERARFIIEDLSEGSSIAVLAESDGGLETSTGIIEYDSPVELSLASNTDRIYVAAWTPATLQRMNPPAEEVLASSSLKFAQPEEARLIDPDEIRSGVLDGETVVASGADLPGALTAAWCSLVDSCDISPAKVHSIVLDPTNASGAQLAVRAKDDVALVQTRGDGLLWRVQLPDGPAMPFVELSTSASFRSAALTNRDEVWMIGPKGRTSIVTSDPWSARDGPAYGDASENTAAITASRGDAPFEVFVLTGSGSLRRSTGGAFEPLYTTEGEFPQDLIPRGLEWLGPGSVAALLQESRQLIIFDNGDARAVDLPDKPKGMSFVEGVGLVVGTDLAGLWVWNGQAIERLIELSTLEPIRRLSGRGDGLAFAIDDSVGWWLPGFDYCVEREFGGSTGQIQDLVEFPSGVLFIPNIGQFSATRVMFLETLPPSVPLCVQP